MLKATAFKAVWVGGIAFTTFGLIAVLVGCSGGTADAGKQEKEASSAMRPHARTDHATTTEAHKVHIEMVANDSGKYLEIDNGHYLPPILPLLTRLRGETVWRLRTVSDLESAGPTIQGVAATFWVLCAASESGSPGPGCGVLTDWSLHEGNLDRT